jgi:DNA repair protein RecO (recombination protein O)
MLIKTRGIVFRALKYSETSLIVDVFTEEKGLRKYLVSGVRSPKARVKAGLLQVMTLVDVVAYEREHRELHRLKEIRPAYVYQSLPFDPRKSAVGMFIAEVARKAIREPEENRPLFNFLFQVYTGLDEANASVANLHLCFLIDFAGFLGFAPASPPAGETSFFFDLQEGHFQLYKPPHPHYLPEAESLALASLMRAGLAHSHTVALGAAQRRYLLARLLDYFRLHIERFPEIHAHQILREIMEDD